MWCLPPRITLLSPLGSTITYGLWVWLLQPFKTYIYVRCGISWTGGFAGLKVRSSLGSFLRESVPNGMNLKSNRRRWHNNGHHHFITTLYLLKQTITPPISMTIDLYPEIVHAGDLTPDIGAEIDDYVEVCRIFIVFSFRRPDEKAQNDSFTCPFICVCKENLRFL